MKSLIGKLSIFILFIFSNSILAYSFEKEHEDEDILDRSPIMKQIKNKRDACHFLDKKIVTFVDKLFFIEKCDLRPIIDTQIYNSILVSKDLTPVPLSEKIYSMLKIGPLFSTTDYNLVFEKQENKATVCKKYKNSLVSSDNYDFYFIEDCKKRKFKNVPEIDVFFAKSMEVIIPISSNELNLLEKGKDIDVKTSQTLTRAKNAKEILDSLPRNRSLICAKINKNIVSFHDSIYFYKNCLIKKIDDPDVEIMRLAETKGGVQELTVQEILGIPEGLSISSSEVLKKLK